MDNDKKSLPRIKKMTQEQLDEQYRKNSAAIRGCPENCKRYLQDDSDLEYVLWCSFCKKFWSDVN